GRVLRPGQPDPNGVGCIRELTAPGVRITDGVTRGVVLMATGAWFDPGFGGKQHKVEQSGNPNVLTLDIGTSRLTQGPNAMSCLVEVALY
ncbi:MAG: molybdopterin dinucleotide binding domain-containing protein, partial [Yersinia sp. (in: enterobacteria)]